MPVLPSYRNQSIDLHSKSIDWFLYVDNTGIFNQSKDLQSKSIDWFLYEGNTGI